MNPNNSLRNPILPDSLFQIHRQDARSLLDVVPMKASGKPLKFVEVTITSPPYFNLKNYGYANQIGHGQGYKEFMKDMKCVLASIYKITNKTGSLWLVVDAYRKNGEVVPLPFELT